MRREDLQDARARSHPGTSPPSRVSVHGGHSAEFCSHARDTLDEVIAAYHEAGFSWVGITEHMPAARDAMVPPEEAEAGLLSEAMRDRFAAYFDRCRALQRDYAGRLEVLVAFEAEIYSESESFTEDLIDEFRPDYVVGSVHHVHDVPIDMSADLYAEAADRSGGIEALYCDYFDLQLALITAFEPAVVGHFDLIRLLDSDYPKRLSNAAVWDRVERNLQKVADFGLILDYNVRALAKGQPEPYVSAPILERARELGIAMVPGDDSHGVATVGLHWDEGVKVLESAGVSTDWRKPGGA